MEVPGASGVTGATGQPGGTRVSRGRPADAMSLCELRRQCVRQGGSTGKRSVGMAHSKKPECPDIGGDVERPISSPADALAARGIAAFLADHRSITP